MKAIEGNNVVVGMDESAMLQSFFLLYIFSLLGMLIVVASDIYI